MMSEVVLERDDIYQRADLYNLPMSATIELNTLCNLKCKHCYIPEHVDPGLPFVTIKNMLTQLRELGTFEIVYTGGEIFSRKDIMDIIKLTREMHFELILFTNLTLLNEEIVKALKALYISLISTTVFSLKEEVHDGITGINGSLKKTLKSLELLYKNNIPVEVKTILMSDNYSDLLSIEKYCSARGFRYVATPYVFPKSNKDMDPINLRMSLTQLAEVIKDVDRINGFSVINKDNDDYICPSIRHSLGINAEGVVSPCNTMFLNVGNINDISLEKIWYSEKLTNIKNLKFKDLDQCLTCGISNHCVRCAGIALLEHGSILEKSKIACQVASARCSIS